MFTPRDGLVTVINSTGFPVELSSFREGEGAVIVPARRMATVEFQFAVKPNPDFKEGDAEDTRYVSSLPKGVTEYTFQDNATIPEAPSAPEEESIEEDSSSDYTDTTGAEETDDEEDEDEYQN